MCSQAWGLEPAFGGLKENGLSHISLVIFLQRCGAQRTEIRSLMGFGDLVSKTPKIPQNAFWQVWEVTKILAPVVGENFCTSWPCQQSKLRTLEQKSTQPSLFNA